MMKEGIHMKNLVKVVALVLVVVFAYACAPKATQDECRTACEKKNALETAAAPKPAPTPDPVMAVEQEYGKKIADVNNAKAAALKPIDDEFMPKIDKAKKPKDKEKLQKDYDAKKAEKAKEFDPQLQTLMAEKATKVKAAQDAKMKAEAEKKAAKEKAITECTDACVQTGVTQPMAQCQAQAADLDAFNACK